MRKTTPVFLGTLIMIGSMIYGSFMYGDLQEAEGKIIQQDQVIKQVEDLNGELESENDKLIIEKQILLDSIDMLHSTIRDLKTQLKKKDAIIADLRSKVNKLNKSYEKLKREIASLKKKGQNDMKQIKSLENEKAQMKQQIESLLADVGTHEQEIIEIKIIEDEKIENLTGLEDLTSILENTQINFTMVSPRKMVDGESIKKLKRKNNNWFYTEIAFQMQYDNSSAIEGKHFILEIIDNDANSVLSYIEGNPQFPESQIDTKGMVFEYPGHEIVLTHKNSALKTGKNYDVQIYLIDGDSQHPMINGRYPIMRDGKVL